MSARIGLPAPDFTMDTVTFDNGFPVPKSLVDYRGKWLLLFFIHLIFPKYARPKFSVSIAELTSSVS